MKTVEIDSLNMEMRVRGLDSTRESDRLLIEDIRQNGVLKPVRVYKGRLVDGFRRVDAARSVGIKSVPYREGK